MAAFAPIPSASDRIATTVTNGALNSARSESLRLRMADGVRDLRGCKPIGQLGRSLQVGETLLLIRELTPSGWAFTPAATMNGVAQLILRLRNSYPLPNEVDCPTVDPRAKSPCRIETYARVVWGMSAGGLA